VLTMPDPGVRARQTAGFHRGEVSELAGGSGEGQDGPEHVGSHSTQKPATCRLNVLQCAGIHKTLNRGSIYVGSDKGS
jgi:hypothetical protein